MRNATLTRTLALAAALSSILMLLAVPAQADIGEKIILKCTHGESLSGFSQKDYNKALKELETSSEEYTDCASLIHKAQLAAAGAGKGTGAGGGPAATAATPATPAERRELSRAPHVGSTPLRVGSQIIRPGVVPVDIASALSSLPNPLLVILAFLLACALALAGGALGNRVRNRHHN
jgi:hypothetical protein